MGEPWRINLFGSLRAQQGEHIVTRFKTQKVASLFAYLAFHLRQAIGSHPNMHVLDWDREFKAHPDWSSDTVHLKPEHFSRYADAIIGAVRNDC